MAPLETQKQHVGGLVDYFLKFEGGAAPQGETQDSKHKGEIELLSWSFGVAQAASVGSATGGGGAGKANFGTFDFAAAVSKASPKLLLACAGGDHFTKATLTCRKAGKDQHEYFSVVFDQVLVASGLSSSFRGMGIEEVRAESSPLSRSMSDGVGRPSSSGRGGIFPHGFPSCRADAGSSRHSRL